MRSFSAAHCLLRYLVGIPEDQAIDLLVTYPALFSLVSDQLPLTAARHVTLVAEDPSQYHPLLFICLVPKLIDEAHDSLPLHVLLDLDSLPGDWLLTFAFFSGRQLALKD